MADSQFDPLTANLVDLQHLLSANKVTSVQIVERYLIQIETHNARFNALISIAPRDIVLRIAKDLDQERTTGHVRGLLHGIPIIVKDMVTTDPKLGMSTTLGSLAFVGSKAKGNSAIAQKLVDAGMIILGKGNMTEFCGMKMTMIMPGWSAHGGQTLSPYVGKIEEGETILGHSAPGGSSTGAAVSVSIGLAPLALGSETIGSLITPCSRHALYGLKPTVGAVDLSGAYAMSDFFDSVGPLAKSPHDLVPLLELLLERPSGSSLQKESDNDPWSSLSIGFASPDVFKLSEEMCRQHEGTAEQMKAKYEERVAVMTDLNDAVKYPIEFPDTASLLVDGEDAIMPIAFWEFKNLGIPKFIKGLTESPVSSLQEIIEFNEKHKDKALPEPYSDQNDLIKSLHNSDNEDHIAYLRKRQRKVARELIDGVFDKEQVELIAAPSDSCFCMYAACAGYPVANLPLGTLEYNGRPFGLCVTARANNETAILRFLIAYEKTFPQRPIPRL
ncbi:amidase signature domain-containing protein [Xylariales sp. AK1849]|nr:amidase signature domain-containing protein [Xylariales sp. AK1849]